ncbi:hypothetical protein ACFL5M_01590 [Candidatus Neomarinimicrobiota bacterium]
MTYRHALLAASLASILSCDRGSYIEGNVYDLSDTTSIADALVSYAYLSQDTIRLHSSLRTVSDSIGRYEIFKSIGPFMPGYLVVLHDDYESDTTEIDGVEVLETLVVDFYLKQRPGNYLVTTLDGITTEQFAETVADYTFFDWPLEIELTSTSLNSSSYVGRVRLAKLGWTPIDRNCTEFDCFLLDTKEKLGPVEFIVFAHLDISSDQIVGTFDPSGPTLDTTPIPFIALRVASLFDIPTSFTREGIVNVH